nr:MAG: hypothetical protein DIU78_05820 [Pseudomonadota bacterium]
MRHLVARKGEALSQKNENPFVAPPLPRNHADFAKTKSAGSARHDDCRKTRRLARRSSCRAPATTRRS